MSEAMTDLEMTKLCAEAMGYVESRDGLWNNGWYRGGYKLDREWNPLHDKAQAFELIDKLNINCIRHFVEDRKVWWANVEGGLFVDGVNNEDLQRAVVQCVANMKAKR